jgi:hypothetical protein
LVFLKKVGAIKDYEAIDEVDFNGEYERMMPTGQIDVFKVEVKTSCKITNPPSSTGTSVPIIV